MSPTGSRICIRAAFIFTGLQVSFSNQAIRLFKISFSVALKPGAIDLAPQGDQVNRPHLANPARQWTITVNESPRKRFGIQGRHLRLYWMRGLGRVATEVRPSWRGR